MIRIRVTPWTLFKFDIRYSLLSVIYRIIRYNSFFYVRFLYLWKNPPSNIKIYLTRTFQSDSSPVHSFMDFFQFLVLGTYMFSSDKVLFSSFTSTEPDPHTDWNNSLTFLWTHRSLHSLLSYVALLGFTVVSYLPSPHPLSVSHLLEDPVGTLKP